MTSTNTIHAVGLGPGDAELLTAGTSRLLAANLPVIVRTRRHPTVDELDPNRLWQDCDDLYQRGGGFDAIYRSVVERVVLAAATSDAIVAASCPSTGSARSGTSTPTFIWSTWRGAPPRA